jgi:hypothetical protein
MFKKTIDWLYWKYGSHNIVALTRAQMVGTTHGLEIGELGLVDRKQLANESQVILDSPAFKLAINNVKSRIMRHIQEEAADTTEIFYDRWTINGVKKIEEELEEYAEMDVQPTEKFDEFAVL